MQLCFLFLCQLSTVSLFAFAVAWLGKVFGMARLVNGSMMLGTMMHGTMMLSMRRSRPSTLSSIFRQLCPRCRMGRIFRPNVHWGVDWGAYWGFPKTNDCCRVCDLLFNREPGYFLGAMYISYALGLALVAALGAIVWLLTGWGFTKVVLWALVIFLPFAPMLTFLSRVLWIYLDQTIDPEMEK